MGVGGCYTLKLLRGANLGLSGRRGRESLPFQRRDESCPAQITFTPRHNYILLQIHSVCLVCCQQLKRLKQRAQNHKNNWHGITCHRLKGRRCLRIHSWEWSRRLSPRLELPGGIPTEIRDISAYSPLCLSVVTSSYLLKVVEEIYS